MREQTGFLHSLFEAGISYHYFCRFCMKCREGRKRWQCNTAALFKPTADTVTARIWSLRRRESRGVVVLHVQHLQFPFDLVKFSFCIISFPISCKNPVFFCWDLALITQTMLRWQNCFGLLWFSWYRRLLHMAKTQNPKLSPMACKHLTGQQR